MRGSTGGAILLLASLLAAAPGCLVLNLRDGGEPAAGQRARQKQAVRALLQEQVRAWNRGDLEGFLDGYWRSPQLRFVGSKGERRGFEAILESYRKSYGEGAALGTLSFDLRDVRILGSDTAFVFGAYHLEHEAKPSGGWFTLLLRDTPRGWRIVHDHSSAAEHESGQRIQDTEGSAGPGAGPAGPPGDA